ncbi:MAG TPA: capsular biosynthesis protein CpsI, partial [Limnochordia bacterium]|nr:capsular biosynthesis protein CpsI [Limnochordia bacterium]
PYKVYNIGNGQPVQLMEFIETLENHLGRMAKKEFLPLQPGDVPKTYADVTDLVRDVGFRPSTSVDEGIRRFVDWYRGYYGSAGERSSTW